MKAPELGIVARAAVERVIDGDTVDVRLLNGLPVRIRLLNCWAPEVRGVEKPAGERSKAFLQNLLPVGKAVRVKVPTGEAVDLGGVLTFGRILGEIWLGDTNVSTLMVTKGLATEEKIKT